ncbi:MAG: hypothetical protein OXC62_14905 [Aestuariivita sp.]|nr:hypothetical protein [Aestuariivita sp.]
MKKPTFNNLGNYDTDQYYTETNNVFHYVPVNQFAPLADSNWMLLGNGESGTVDSSNPWQYWLTVTSVNRSTRETSSSYKIGIQIVSYNQNIFRIRFDPSVGIGNYKDKVFGPVTQSNLLGIRSNEIKDGAPDFGLFDFKDNQLSFRTKDLTIEIDSAFKTTVKYKDTVIHTDADSSIDGFGLGATFVDPSIGKAVATIKKNANEDVSVKERFYGQGEVNVTNAGKSVADGGYYVLGKTGISMTNFNYDQIDYVHRELAPVGFGQNTLIPDYFFPMYFSAPWIKADLYTKNNRVDGGKFLTDGNGPEDAYCGQLSYGPNANITAIFPDWDKSGTAEWWGRIITNCSI